MNAIVSLESVWSAYVVNTTFSAGDAIRTKNVQHRKILDQDSWKRAEKEDATQTCSRRFSIIKVSSFAI